MDCIFELSESANFLRVRRWYKLLRSINGRVNEIQPEYVDVMNKSLWKPAIHLSCVDFNLHNPFRRAYVLGTYGTDIDYWSSSVVKLNETLYDILRNVSIKLRHGCTEDNQFDAIEREIIYLIWQNTSYVYNSGRLCLKFPGLIRCIHDIAGDVNVALRCDESIESVVVGCLALCSTSAIHEMFYLFETDILSALKYYAGKSSAAVVLSRTAYEKDIYAVIDFLTCVDYKERGMCVENYYEALHNIIAGCSDAFIEFFAENEEDGRLILSFILTYLVLGKYEVYKSDGEFKNNDWWLTTYFQKNVVKDILELKPSEGQGDLNVGYTDVTKKVALKDIRESIIRCVRFSDVYKYSKGEFGVKFDSGLKVFENYLRSDNLFFDRLRI